MWDLIGEDCLTEKISSWTLDIEVTKAFKGGVPPEEQEYLGVILCVYPQSSNVIVNLREMYQDHDFTAALEQNRANITGYHDGAGRYGAGQNEVVLEVASVTQQDIYSMGGHSSPFDELVNKAAKLIHGRAATPPKLGRRKLTPTSCHPNHKLTGLDHRAHSPQSPMHLDQPIALHDL